MEEPEVAKLVKTKRSKVPLIIIISVSAILVTLLTIFGIQFFTKTGVFYRPGTLIFDPSVTEVDQNFVQTTLGDRELKSDLTVSTTTSLNKLQDSPNFVLYNILLPVTSWDDPNSSISAEAAKNSNLISIWDLDASQKLLAIDGEYYFDNYTNGAFFEYLVFTSENENELKEVVDLMNANIAPFPSSDSILTLAQTGVTALSRGMYRALKQVGNATHFAEYIAPFLNQFDYTHTSNEASFSQSASANNICAAPQMIDVLTAIGLDIVELTGNHNQDCGDQDAIATIDQYHNLGMQTFGGGKTAEEAAVPLEINVKNTAITMLGYNLSTGGYTTDATPGANFYIEENAAAQIAAAKAAGNFVIVDVQYYECNNYVFTTENTTCDYANSAAGDQIGFFRHLIDLGADIVVGTSAHQPQTFEQYHGGAIYYGLGNLFFDQSWWPGTTRSLILVHYFYQGKHLQTRIVPTIYDQTYQTKLLEQTDATAFLARLLSARPE